MPTARILIVDDEPFNIDLVHQELEELGYELEDAANGRDALVQVAQRPPDLILLDVMMPELDGFETCRRLKEGPDTKLIPVVMMTALGSVEDRIRGIEAGADDFLTKPVDDRELKARIQTLLKRKHVVDEQIAKATRTHNMEKFVPESVRRVFSGEQSSTLPRKECDVAALMVDIAGYTQLSEALPLQQIGSLVETYFTAFLDCISGHSGEVCDFAGDGFLAIFREGTRDQRGVTGATAALDLIDATAILNRTHRLTPIDIHVGVSAGTALVGMTRFEGMHNSRWIFSAAGPPINLAARLCKRAGPGEVLISRALRDRLGPEFESVHLGLVAVKNIAEPVDVYKLGARR